MKGKYIVLGIVLCMAVAFSPGMVFAQETQDPSLESLRAMIVQLLALIAELQQQLFVVQQTQISANVASVGLQCAQIEVAWKKVSGAQEYVLFRNGSKVYEGRDIQFTDTGLATATTYNYAVHAKNAGGLGPASVVKTITTSTQCPPAAPVITAQPGVCGGAVHISWNRISGATFYEVFRGKTRISGGNANVVVDRGLQTDRQYSYKVRAGNFGGLGEFSSELQVMSSAVCPPNAPEELIVGTPFLEENIAQEGIFITNIHSRPSGVTAQSGKSAANILAFRAEAKLSPLTVETVSVDFADRAWLFLQEVQIRDGSRLVKSLPATQSNFSKVGDTAYRITFTGLNIPIAKDRARTISVYVVAKDNLVNPDPRQIQVSIPTNSVRARDQINIAHFEPRAGVSAAFTKPFFVKRVEIKP